MKTNYFFLLFFLLILMGCSDDKNIPDIPASTEDTYEGVHDLISFTKETEDFTYGDLTFHIKTPDGNIIQRKAKHRRLSGTSLFTMEKGLKEVKYQLLYMEYTIQSDCPDIDGRNGEFGMGCYITVSENGISTETNRDERIGLYGNGTPEDPYRITSADDLAKIQEAILNFHNNGNLVNSYTCFEQQNDISMANYNDQCGWEGNWYQIGLSASYPFTGYYDGNGYTIRDLKMLDKNAVGASLFGFVNQAIISNLTIEKATITGYGALSAIVGAVTTKGGSINKTFIKGCVVKKSTIESRSDGVVTDGMAIGGIAGMVDPNVNLWIDSCSVEDCTINGAIAVGGILGGGTVYSMTQITNSHNRNTKVTASYNCAGGIVGYADTLYVYSCSNNGTIKGAASTTAPPGNLPANSIYNVGTGGIAGGSGLSTIISSRNSGTVQGSRGVGGIIGSTLVTTQPRTYYNNTFIGFCSNSGNINGDSYIGGLCGEAQLGAYKSYNEGMIEANSSFAGGILGFAPLASITNTANFNKVIASSYSGGIAGSILAGSLGINTNLGEVASYHEYAGGMIGRAGNTLAMNYCSNFAPISGSSYLGGMIGEVGDAKKWTIMDGVSLGFATFELASTLVGFVPFAKIVGESGEILVNCALTVLSLVLNDIDILSEGFSVFGLISHGHPEIIETERLKGVITHDIAMLESDMDTKLANKIDNLSFASIKLRSKDMTNRFMSNRKALTVWFESGANHQIYSDAMNYKRGLLSKQILKSKKNEEVLHTVVSGVCCAVNSALLFVTVITFPEGVPAVALMGGALALVSFGNSVSATLDDFVENSVVITQCLNAGEIGQYSSGGLVAQLQQSCLISDCINMGRSNKRANALIGVVNPNVRVGRNLNVGENWYLFAPPASVSYFGNYCMLGTVEQPNPVIMNIFSLQDLKSEKTFTGWDFDVKWEIPSNETGSFPIPKKSEMQFDKPNL